MIEMLAARSMPHNSALEFFEKHYSRLVLAAYRITGSHEDAEDLVREVYIEVSARWSAIESPWTYVNQALARRAVAAVNRQSALVNLLVRFIPAARQHAPSAERLAELRQDAELVQKAFRRLPTQQRMIAGMYFYLEYTPGEIAIELAITRQTVNTQIARIKTKLRKEFGIPLPVAREDEA